MLPRYLSYLLLIGLVRLATGDISGYDLREAVGTVLLAVENALSQQSEEKLPAQSLRVVLQGWSAEATAGFTISGTNNDVHSCLEECRVSSFKNGSFCRLVTFNLETGICSQFSKAAFGAQFRYSRNEDFVLAGYSDQKFRSRHNVKFREDSGQSTALATLTDVSAAPFCKELSHLYPSCNIATYRLWTSSYSDNIDSFDDCELKQATAMKAVYDRDYSSYVS